ncbi:MAG: Mut7-C RNAse domain-containing protein [Anaerolineales bacterium]
MGEFVHQASFRFYAELKDFLPNHYQYGQISYRFRGEPAVKDAIEAIGVPHPEVSMILIDGQPAGFDSPLRDGAHVSVFPAFRSLPLEPDLTLQLPALERPRFVADIHLGQLSRYLRMIGFDCRYSNQAEDAWLAAISSEENRILLTRDVELLKRSLVTRGYYLRAVQPRLQLLEVVRRFDLVEKIQPFQFCMECNGRLEAVDKEDVWDQLPPSVQHEHERFMRCQGCGRVYWGGSHVDRMQQVIDWLQQEAGSAGAG